MYPLILCTPKRTINAPRKITCRDRHRKTPASLLCRYSRIPTKLVVAIRLLHLSFRIARVYLDEHTNSAQSVCSTNPLMKAPSQIFDFTRTFPTQKQYIILFLFRKVKGVRYCGHLDDFHTIFGSMLFIKFVQYFLLHQNIYQHYIFSGEINIISNIYRL